MTWQYRYMSQFVQWETLIIIIILLTLKTNSYEKDLRFIHDVVLSY